MLIGLTGFGFIAFRREPGSVSRSAAIVLDYDEFAAAAGTTCAAGRGDRTDRPGRIALQRVGRREAGGQKRLGHPMADPIGNENKAARA